VMVWHTTVFIANGTKRTCESCMRTPFEIPGCAEVYAQHSVFTVT
jgi:hypothetical protein